MIAKLGPLRLVGAALAALLLFLLLRGAGLAGLLDQLRRADAGLVALAMAINLLPNSLARARRFQALLEPLPRRRAATLGEIFWVQLGGHVASHLLPARAGEALRTVHLHRRCGYPVGALVAAQVVEKVFDVLSMATLALLALAVLPCSPLGSGGPAARPLAGSLRAALYGLTGLGALVLAALYLATRHGGLSSPGGGAGLSGSDSDAGAPAADGPFLERARAALAGFLQRLRQALGLLHAPRIWLAAHGFSLVADATDVLMVGVCLRALGIPTQGPLEWLIILAALSALTSVPLTPGQVGVVEAGGVLVLAALGVPRDAGLAFGLLYHATHSVSVLLPGAVWLAASGRASGAATRAGARGGEAAPR